MIGASDQAWLIVGNEGYGVRESVRQLVRGLRSQGVRTHAICLEPGSFTDEARTVFDTVTVVDVPRRGLPTGGVVSGVKGTLVSTAHLRGDGHTVAEALRATGADVLNVVWPDVMPLAAQAARRVGVGLSWHVMNLVGQHPLDLNRRLFALQLGRARARIFASSRATREELGFRLPSEVLPLAADETRFSPAGGGAELRTELGIPAGVLVAGLIARLDPTKGQEDLLRALGSVDERVHVLLVGGAGDEAYGRRLRDLAPAGRVTFAGFSPSPERFYPAIDVALNLRTEIEPFGISVVEAMLSGKPVLAAAPGGPSDTVVPSVGWLIDSVTPANVSAGLARALEDQGSWTAMGAAGRERALELYTGPAVARTYLNLLASSS